MSQSHQLDINAYLDRVGLSAPRAVDADFLRRVQTAHLGAIPFENLDVLLGHRIALDLRSLEAKLVRSRRGGYCFEQNTLFAAVLRAFGLAVTTLEARVRPPGAARPLPRTHMVLRIDLGDHALLTDVGFGGDGPLEPVDLDGAVSEQAGDAYRIVVEDRLKVLQIRRDGGWQDLYAFTLDEALPIDYEVANHFTSTWPGSPFVTTLTAQRSLPGERRILRHRTYTVRRGEDIETREVADAELPALLADAFGLELAPGLTLPTAG